MTKPPPYPWKCQSCGATAVRPVIVDYCAEMPHDGSVYHIEVPCLELWECYACKTRVLTDDGHIRVAESLREKTGRARCRAIEPLEPLRPTHKAAIRACSEDAVAFNEATELLTSNGIFFQVSIAIDGEHQMMIRRGPEPDSSFVVSLLRRPGRWLFSCRAGVFEAGVHADIGRLCNDMLNCTPDELNAEFLASLGLCKLGHWLDWLQSRWVEKHAAFEAQGWKLLSREANRQAYLDFAARFGLRMSTRAGDWPSINEPKPFVTYDISAALGVYNTFNRLDESLRRRFLDVLRTLPSCGQFLALSINHAGFVFRPRDVTHLKWPLPFTPDGEYHIFLDMDFENGIFGHPWEKSLCVFGPELAHRFELPEYRVMRRNP